jgi:aspartate/tyrosine/aromatic aminotransferase
MAKAISPLLVIQLVWCALQEMEMMSGRIKSMRQQLHDHLVDINPDKDWSFILRQIGMFSYTGVAHQSHASCA